MLERGRTRWRSALVTGASSGIGEEFARQIASRGTDLVLVARRRDRLQDLASELRGQGCKVEVIVADLADSDGLSQVEARLGESGGVDLLVNNAGFGTRGLFASLPVDEEEREIRVNVLAAVRLSRAALPAMVEAGHGDIVNVSSVASIQPIPYWATYSATKAYLTSFSLSVHEEVKRSGVNVMALLPGFTRTEFQRRKNLDVPAIPDPLWMSSEQVVRKALRAVMRGRALCVPGTRYRLITSLSRVTPWSVSRRLLRAGGVQMNRTEGR